MLAGEAHRLDDILVRLRLYDEARHPVMQAAEIGLVVGGQLVGGQDDPVQFFFERSVEPVQN